MNGHAKQRCSVSDLDNRERRNGLQGTVEVRRPEATTPSDRQASTLVRVYDDNYTISGLNNGTQYTVRVIATKTGANDGPPSVEKTGTPVRTSYPRQSPSDPARSPPRRTAPPRE